MPSCGGMAGSATRGERHRSKRREGRSYLEGEPTTNLRPFGTFCSRARNRSLNNLKRPRLDMSSTFTNQWCQVVLAKLTAGTFFLCRVVPKKLRLDSNIAVNSVK